MQQLDPTTDQSFLNFLPGMPQEDDRALIPEFFLGKKLMGAKSEAAKREIYEDREFLRIIIKGQPHGVPVHEVRDEHRQRFPVAYARFKANLPTLVVGTPIEQLAGVGPSLAHHLKGLHLRTVDDLANVTDENTLNRIGMGARDLVSKAKAFLSKSSEQAVNLAQENEQLRKMLAEKTDSDRQRDEEMARMREQIEALSKSRGGRPKKQDTPQ